MAKGLEITAEAVIVSVVEEKNGVSDAGKPWHLYAVSTPDGTKWKTFNKVLAEKALKLVGHPATIKGDVWQKGEFTNYDLLGIEAVAPGTPGMAAAVKAAETAQATIPVAPTIPAAAPVSPPKGLEEIGKAPELSFTQYAAHADAKTDSIHRQTACKVAATLAQAEAQASGHVTASDFWENVRMIYSFMHEGAMPEAYREKPVTAEPSAHQPVQSYVHTDADAPPDDDFGF